VPDTIRIDAGDDGRFHRQTLIAWWDQERIRSARVLVIGAGALGNEILKLLALTGIGAVAVVDMDVIESSNLSRSVLFRDGDVGRTKVAAATEAMAVLDPGGLAHGIAANVVLEAGLGLFLWADVVICGLDNREARVFVNSACARTGRVWVDGAIEALSGIVRVFDPGSGPCYECTMNATDRRLYASRRSCAQLARNAARLGHVPATAVSASIVAGLQVQEALKALHGLPTLKGEGLHLDGLGNTVERIRYPQREDCPGHDCLLPIRPLGLGTSDVSIGGLLDRAERALGVGAVLDLSRDVILSLTCPGCGLRSPGRAVVGAVSESAAACPSCGVHRVVDFTSYLDRDSPVDQGWTLRDLGLPRFDVVVARRGADAREAWLFDGDGPDVLGPLAPFPDSHSEARP
jgi:adenylyltransferase/sulfurtransferase